MIITITITIIILLIVILILGVELGLTRHKLRRYIIWNAEHENRSITEILNIYDKINKEKEKK